MEQPCKSKPNPWFAVSVKSRTEKSVATIARHKGFEEFLPLYQCRRRWSDRVKSVELPLFPGYVFCRLNPEYRLPLLTIPGVFHIVGAGKIPVPLDEAEITALQAAAQSGLPTEPWPFLGIGQRVLVEHGPLMGLEGLLVEIRKHFRIVLSVTLLNRSVAIEIDRDWVTPLGTARQIPASFHFTPSEPAGSLLISPV
jgi:transcription antitermination factor NusG